MSIRFDQKTAVAGESVTMTEVVSNRKPLSIPMFQYRYGLCRNFDQMNGPDGRRKYISYKIALPALRAVRNQTKLPGLQRGVYTIADCTIGAQDLFYTDRFSATFRSSSRLTVYPDKLPVQMIQLPYQQLLGAVLTKRYAQEDSFEIRNIRPYEPYDSMRSVNWKASARTGELKVNQHNYTTEESLSLILDMEHGTEEQRESIIRLASSLCALFLHRGISVSLYANGRSCVGGEMIWIPAGGGSSHQAVIDHNLAQIKLAATVPAKFVSFLNHLSDTAAPGSVFAVISAGGSAEISSAFDRLCGRQAGYYIHITGDASVPAGRNFTVIPFTEGVVTP